MPKKNRFFVVGLIQFTLSLSLLYFAISYIDLENSLQLIKSLDITFFLLSIILIVSQILLNSMRWKLFLEKIKKIKILFLIKHSYIISFLNQVLPSSIGGDIYKVFITNKIVFSIPKSISLVVTEKYFVLSSLLILILFQSIISNLDFPNWISKLLLVIIPIFAFSVISIVGLFFLKKLDFRKKLIKKIQKIASEFFIFFSDKKLILNASIVSFCCHINLMLIFFTVGYSLGIKVNIIELSFIFFIVLLVSQIPISIGGWGVRETSTMTGMILLGVPKEQSFILSTLFGILLLLTHIPAIFFLMSNRFNDIKYLIKN